MKINLREEATQELIERYTQYLEAVQATNDEINQTFIEVMESSKYNQLKLLISDLLKQYEVKITQDMENGIFGQWASSDASVCALCRHYCCGEDAEEVCKQMENSLFDQMHNILKIDTVEAVPVDAPVISDEGMTRLEDVCAKAVKDTEDLTQRTVGQMDVLANENDFFGALKPLVLGVGQTSISFFQSARQAFLNLHETIKETDTRDMQNKEESASSRMSDHAVVGGVVATESTGGSGGTVPSAEKKYSEDDLKLALELLERIVTAFGGSQALLGAAQQVYPYITHLQQVALDIPSQRGGSVPVRRTNAVAGSAAEESAPLSVSPATRVVPPASAAASEKNSTAFFAPSDQRCEQSVENHERATTQINSNREQPAANTGISSTVVPVNPYGRYIVTDYTKRIMTPVAEELFRYARAYEEQYETIIENGQIVEENTKKISNFLSCGARVVGCLGVGLLGPLAKQVLNVDLSQRDWIGLLMPMISSLAANKSDVEADATVSAINAHDSQQALSQLIAYLQKGTGGAYKGIQTLLLNKKISKMMKNQQQISPQYKVMEVFLDDHRLLKKKRIYSVADTQDMAYPRNIALTIENATNRLAFIACFFAMGKITTDCHCERSIPGKVAMYTGMWVNLLRSGFCTFTAVPNEEANKIVDQYFDILARRDGCLPATNYVLEENGIVAK